MYVDGSFFKCNQLKFIYSEKATKFLEISTLLLTGTTQGKSKVEISRNFVAFSDNMNFTMEVLGYEPFKKYDVDKYG